MLDFTKQRVKYGTLKQLFKESEDLSNSVIIVSPTSYRKILNARKLSIANIPSQTIVWSENKPFSEYDKYKGAHIYIGFGGGTAIDIAKYLAKKSSSKCIAIPSMLSTNVFATNKVAKVLDGHNKTTVNGVLPKEIWYDDEVISLSKKENLYGLADAFSIYTALTDWVYADSMGQEKLNRSVYDKANNILFSAIGHVLNESNSQRDIFNILIKAGYITNEYGSGRPESGSEHIIAKEIENLVKVPHALAVCCGIMIMMQIQPHSLDTMDKVQTCFDKMGILDEVRNSVITPEILNKVLLNVKPRPDRYTYLNTCKPFTSELIDGSKIW